MEISWTYLAVSMGVVFLAAGCATPKSVIDPQEQMAFVDTGMDYYSQATDGERSVVDSNNWIEDADGNRVYTLSRVQRGSYTQYFIGDSRYWAPAPRRGYATIAGFDNRYPANANGFPTSYDPTTWQNPNGYVPYLRGSAISRGRANGTQNPATPQAPSSTPSSAPTSTQPRAPAPQRAPQTSRGSRSGPEPTRSSRSRSTTEERSRRTP